MPMMMRRIGRAAVGTAVIAGTAGAVHHHQEKKWANENAQAQQQAYDQQQAAYQQGAADAQAQYVQQAPAAAPAAAPADPTTAQLENLANLHAQGVLSDEEFAAAKAKVLGI